jgi:MFS family permease
MAALAAAFMAFGLFWGGWAVGAADVERSLHVGHGVFGLLFSVALVGAATANAAAATWAERWGTGRVLAGGLAVWSVALAAMSLLRTPALLAVALVVVVTAAGAVDVVLNVAATAALSDRPGALVRFHGLFNVGAAVGAGAMGLLLGAGASWRWHWAGVAVVVAALGAVCRAAPMPAGEAGERVALADALRRLRHSRLWLIALAFAMGAMVEGGVELWGVLFLRTTLKAGIGVGATGAVVGYAIASAARIGLGPLAGRRGAAAGVATGAGLACVGIVVLIAGPSPLVAAVGFVAAAGGVSMCWPLLLALAAQGIERPGPVVGAVSAVGYLGFVIGPTVVGGLAGVTGLRAGLGLLAAAALFVAVVPVAWRVTTP